MANENINKHQVLEKGGEHAEAIDSIESWLDFLTNPSNLKPGLPKLTVKITNQFGSVLISVTFAEQQASLKSLALQLDYLNDDAKAFKTTSSAKQNSCSAPILVFRGRASSYGYTCFETSPELGLNLTKINMLAVCTTVL